MSSPRPLPASVLLKSQVSCLLFYFISSKYNHKADAFDDRTKMRTGEHCGLAYFPVHKVSFMVSWCPRVFVPNNI